MSTPSPLLSIRPATVDDVPLVRALIGELAEYERLADAAVATDADLRAQLFGERPAAEVLIGEVDGEPAGFALFFHNFSTFLGKHLMAALARIAVQRDCGRFEWSVLDWNAPAIGFYRRIGAVGMDEWTVQRLEGEALHALASHDAL